MSDHQKYSYTKLGLRRWRRPARGFRLSPARVSVSVRGLRARLWTLLGILGRYMRDLRLVTRGRVAAGSSSPPAAATGSRRFLVGGPKRALAAGKGGQAAGGGSDSKSNSKAPRRPPCMRSNSFYARAVAECLEFIKGSNVPPASPSPPEAHGTPRRGSRC